MTNVCFLASSLNGATSTGTFASDLPKLKTDFNSNMTVRQVNLCGTEGTIEGIQAVLSDGKKTISLTPLGKMVSCETWKVPDGDYVQQIEISYTSFGLKHVQLVTHGNVVAQKGAKNS